jgi:hypothetical protein
MQSCNSVSVLNRAFAYCYYLFTPFTKVEKETKHGILIHYTSCFYLSSGFQSFSVMYLNCTVAKCV